MNAVVLMLSTLCFGQVDQPLGREIGSVPLGSVKLPLYEATRSIGKPPSEWQFRYTPAFVPQTDDKGRIVASGPTRLPSGKYEITIDLLLGTSELDELAYEEVKQIKRDKADQIRPRSVFVWQAQWVRLSLPAPVSKRFPTLQLARSSWNLDVSKPLNVTFWLDSETGAKEMMGDLDSLSLDIEYSLEGAKTDRNGVDVTSDDVRQSKLRAELDGLGTNLVYIRRWDLRTLCESVRSRLRLRGAIEILNGSTIPWRIGLARRLKGKRFRHYQNSTKKSGRRLTTTKISTRQS